MATVKLYKTKKPTKDKAKRQVWVLRWYGTDGKRHSDTIGEVGELTKRDAEYLQRKMQGEMDNGIIKRDRPKRITLAEMLAEYEEAMRAVRRPRTIRQTKIAGKHAETVLGGQIAVSKINRASARRIIRHLAELNRSEATIRKTITKLRTIFGYGMRGDYLTENPFAGLELPKIQPKQKRVFIRSEISLMLKASPSLWWRSFITTAVGTGLRLEELLHLMWRDVDLKKGSVVVAAKRAESFDVLNTGSFPVFKWEAKSHAERCVTASPEAVSTLREMQEASDGSVYVFVDLDRLRALDARQKAGKLRADFEMVNNVLRDFKTIQKHAFEGLDGDHPVGTIHDLRKTFGTWMAEAIPMHVLQRLMGHADISTTARFYLSVSDAYADQIHKALSLNTDAQVTPKPKLRLVGGSTPAA